MFSGKTTELLRRIDRGDPNTTRVFKHVVDTRYSSDAVVSHAGESCPSVAVATADVLLGHVDDRASLVAVDEAHFFDPALVETVQLLRDRGVDVVLASLDRDSWGRPFAGVQRLAQIADGLERRTTSCARCGAEADRTQRLTPIVDGCLVGGSESYEPRCDKCWHAPPEPPPRVT
jgi:thymidine kinase